MKSILLEVLALVGALLLLGLPCASSRNLKTSIRGDKRRQRQLNFYLKKKNQNQQTTRSLESESKAEEEDDPPYLGCLCPCHLWYEDKKKTSGVIMYAVDEDLVNDNGGYYMCVEDAESIIFNTHKKAICDDECFFPDSSSKSSDE